MKAFDWEAVIPTGPNAGLTRRASFETKVVAGPGCHIWSGPFFPNGYGRFSVAGRDLLAHRVAFVLAGNHLPRGLLVLHGCDVKACVNPAHLRAGTQQENVDDAVSRGRLAPLFGQSSPRAKLSTQQVKQIIDLRAEGVKVVVLAARFGVSAKQISVVARGIQRRRG